MSGGVPSALSTTGTELVSDEISLQMARSDADIQSMVMDFTAYEQAPIRGKELLDSVDYQWTK